MGDGDGDEDRVDDDDYDDGDEDVNEAVRPALSKHLAVTGAFPL